MKGINTMKITVAAAVVTLFAGCASWDEMSSRQKGGVAGAGVGGVAGAAVTGGSVLGTVGGAAIGGVVGDQIGKHKEKK